MFNTRFLYKVIKIRQKFFSLYLETPLRVAALSKS
jgi:hypothetical protein